MSKLALVLGAGVFIGSHMVKRLKSEGYWVRGVDIKYPEFSSSMADDFIEGDLCEPHLVESIIHANGKNFDEIYQFAIMRVMSQYALFYHNNRLGHNLSDHSNCIVIADGQ